MPELKITIGGRDFEVSCREGEESFLQSAAAMLNTEASVLASQVGRIPESRMLLMAGLMLADKTAGVEDQVRQLRQRLSETEAKLEQARLVQARPAERVEVAVIPADVTQRMAELVAEAEALADTAERA